MRIGFAQSAKRKGRQEKKNKNGAKSKSKIKGIKSYYKAWKIFICTDGERIIKLIQINYTQKKITNVQHGVYRKDVNHKQIFIITSIAFSLFLF